MRNHRSLALGSLALAAFALAAIREFRRAHPPTSDLMGAFDIAPVPYDDRQIQGTSVSRVDTLPGRVQFHWTLGTAPSYPFVGFLWEDTAKFHDLRDGDSLRLDWESDFGRSVRITLLLDLPGLTHRNQPLTRIYLQMEATPPRQRATTTLALAEFRPPAWWYRENHLTYGPIEQPMERVVGLSFESGEVAAVGDSDIVRIHGITVVDRAGSFWPSLLLVVLGGGCVLALFWPARFAPLKPAAPDAPPLAPPIAVTPMPLDIPTSRSGQIRTWMETNYARADLTLEHMSRDLGLSDDVLSREIRRTFQDTFKGTLNRLRLTEARRLLAESELGIAEIAYKVGYGNISHFNRLAKEAWGCPPTELRARLRSPEEAS